MTLLRLSEFGRFLSINWVADFFRQMVLAGREKIYFPYRRCDGVGDSPSWKFENGSSKVRSFLFKGGFATSKHLAQWVFICSDLSLPVTPLPGSTVRYGLPDNPLVGRYLCTTRSKKMFLKVLAALSKVFALSDMITLGNEPSTVKHR